MPADVGALVSEIGDRRTVVTLVNLSPSEARTVVVQGGGYAEHALEAIAWNGQSRRLSGRDVTIRLAPGAGATFTLAMRRYANPPTVSFPWDR